MVQLLLPFASCSFSLSGLFICVPILRLLDHVFWPITVATLDLPFASYIFLPVCLYLLIAFPARLLVLIIEYIYAHNISVLCVRASSPLLLHYYHSVGCARVIVRPSVTGRLPSGRQANRHRSPVADLLISLGWGVCARMKRPGVIGESRDFHYAVSFPSSCRWPSSE